MIRTFHVDVSWLAIIKAPTTRARYLHASRSLPIIMEASSGCDVAGTSGLAPLSARMSAALVVLQNTAASRLRITELDPCTIKVVGVGLETPAVAARRWIAAAANASSNDIVLLTADATTHFGDPAVGWSGEDVADAFNLWTQHPSMSQYKGWSVHPPLALMRDATHDPQPSTLAVSVHVLSTALLRVPIVRKNLMLDSNARYVLLLEIRPSSSLVLLANVSTTACAALPTTDLHATTPKDNSPRACWQRNKAGSASPFHQATAVRDRMLRALVFAELVAARQDGRGSGWPDASCLVGADHKLLHESQEEDWKSAALWLSSTPAALSSSLKQLQDSAILSTAFDYAAAFLNVAGGGSLVVGIWDTEPAAGYTEGVINVPADPDGKPYADELAMRLRGVLREALFPWRDEWLRVVSQDVVLDKASFLRASAVPLSTTGVSIGRCYERDDGDDSYLFVASFVSRRAITKLRQSLRALEPIASLPLPLLAFNADGQPILLDDVVDNDQGDGVFAVPLDTVFRVPMTERGMVALVAALQKVIASGGATASSARWSDVSRRLPGLMLLHVQFCAFPKHTTGAVCTRYDVAAPVLTSSLPRGGPLRLRYLPWDDIMTRLRWETPEYVAQLNATLTSPSVCVVCWNMCAAQASKAMFSVLQQSSAAEAWFCEDVAPLHPDEWGNTALRGMDVGVNDLILILVCVDDSLAGDAGSAGATAVKHAETAFRGTASAALAVSPNARVFVVADSVSLGSRLLDVASTAASYHQGSRSASSAVRALQCGTVIPSAAITRMSLACEPLREGAVPRLSDVRVAAAAYLRGESVPAAHLQQLLLLPRDERVDFERSQQSNAVRALVATLVGNCTRGGVHSVVLGRQHAAAGAATLALRALSDAGCSSCLVAGTGDADCKRLQVWIAEQPPPARLAIVMRYPPGPAADQFLSLALGGRAAAVVHIVENGAHAAAAGASVRRASIIVSGQLLTDTELRDAVARYSAVLPSRRASLDAFLHYALPLPPSNFQRSITALAVAAHMDAFIPLRDVLRYSFPPIRTPVVDLSIVMQSLAFDAKVLVAAALFHAFHVSIVHNHAPRLLRQFHLARLCMRSWHLIGYTPRNPLPVTVHEDFARIVLRRAATRYGSSTRAMRMLSLVSDVLVWLVAEEGVPAQEAAWVAAMQNRESGARLSNVVGAAFAACGAAGACQLVNRVRQALGVAPHATTYEAGARLLVISSRVWRIRAQEQQASEPRALEDMQRALKYAILAVRHWGTMDALKCAVNDACGSPDVLLQAAQTALRNSATDDFVVRHWLAMILAECGVQLGRMLPFSPGPPQQYVAHALEILLDLRGDSAGYATTTARAIFEQFRSIAVRLGGVFVPALCKAYASWAEVLHLPLTLADYCAADAREAPMLAGRTIAAAGEKIFETPVASDARFAVLFQEDAVDGCDDSDDE